MISLRRPPLARQQQAPRRAGTIVPIGGRAATRATKANSKPLLSPSTRGRASASTTTTTETSALASSSSSSPSSLSVVITGGSSGLGKAIAREHLAHGDSVVVASRDESKLLAAARERADETGAELVPPCPPRPSPLRRPTITPIVADVSDLSSVENLVSLSLRVLGRVDAFYANAGESGGYMPFASSRPSDLSRVVGTNLLGAVLCSRVAMEAMRSSHAERRKEEGEEGGKDEKKRSAELAGHLFRVEGAGSDLSATPGHACYGATKAATAQLVRSLAAEERERARGGRGSAPAVGVHALSPGRVLTPLLLSGLFPAPEDGGGALPPRSRARALAFDALCEHPEVVAEFLVPRARDVVLGGVEGKRAKTSSPIRYLTPPRAVLKLLSRLLFERGRHFSTTDASPLWVENDKERIRRAKETRESERSRGEKRRREFAATAALFLFAVAVAAVGRGGGAFLA